MLGVGAVFAEYSEHLEKEAEVKENLRLTIKELEQAARDIHTLLQRVHRPGGVRDTPALVTAVAPTTTAAVADADATSAVSDAVFAALLVCLWVHM